MWHQFEEVKLFIDCKSFFCDKQFGKGTCGYYENNGRCKWCKRRFRRYFGYSCYHHQCNCNLQLHLHDLVFRFKQNHFFFCRLYKESFKKAKHRFVFLYLYLKFDVETWNVWCWNDRNQWHEWDWVMPSLNRSSILQAWELLLQYLPFQNASTVYLWYLSIKSTNAFLF